MRSLGRILGVSVLLMATGCQRPQSSFAFTLSGDISTQAHSEPVAPGQIDNGGYLAIDDQAWGLKLDMNGLAPGSRTIAKGNGEVAIMSKASGDVFATELGGSCTVWLDAHQSTNGSAVSGWFTCQGLTAQSGAQVEVEGGRFRTFIDDSSNNPSSDPPSPGV